MYLKICDEGEDVWNKLSFTASDNQRLTYMGHYQNHMFMAGCEPYDDDDPWEFGEVFDAICSGELQAGEFFGHHILEQADLVGEFPKRKLSFTFRLPTVSEALAHSTLTWVLCVCPEQNRRVFLATMEPGPFDDFDGIDPQLHRYVAYTTTREGLGFRRVTRRVFTDTEACFARLQEPDLKFTPLVFQSRSLAQSSPIDPAS